MPRKALISLYQTRFHHKPPFLCCIFSQCVSAYKFVCLVISFVISGVQNLSKNSKLLSSLDSLLAYTKPGAAPLNAALGGSNLYVLTLRMLEAISVMGDPLIFTGLPYLVLYSLRLLLGEAPYLLHNLGDLFGGHNSREMIYITRGNEVAPQLT